MENDYFQNRNIKHNYNIINRNQETMWQELGRVFYILVYLDNLWVYTLKYENKQKLQLWYVKAH